MKLQTDPAPVIASRILNIPVFAVGHAGLNVVEQLIAYGLPPETFVALNTDLQTLSASTAGQKIHLASQLSRSGTARGGSDREALLEEEQSGKVKSLCQGAQVVFLIAGLGGRTGTRFAPELARIAKESGTLVLAFVTTPFECEGNRRQALAQQALEEIKAAADGVICLPNQKAVKLIDENTSLMESFKLANRLLAEGVRGIWQLLTHEGLIRIHFTELCALVRERHVESAFAAAEAVGATRSREVLAKLLSHPLLDGGQILAESDAVMVSLIAGPDLTMAEVNRVMEQINGKCENAQVIMGAAIDETFRERLAVTVIAARRSDSGPGRELRRAQSAETLTSLLLPPSDPPRPGSRFVPPPPVLPPEKLEQILARQGTGPARGRKASPRLRQGQLPLEIISKGRFDKSEPTIYKGEDLDVPTYIRRGVALN